MFLPRETLAPLRPPKLLILPAALSSKVGMVLVVLGIMHFFNLFVFSKMRQRALPKHPPVIPTAYQT